MKETMDVSKKKLRYKQYLALEFLAVILLLNVRWYKETKIDRMTFQFLDETGIDVFQNFHCAYLILYTLCVCFYLYSLNRDIYQNLYICDGILILAFTAYPVLSGKALKFVGWHIVRFYAEGYVLAMLLWIVNMVLLHKMKKTC